MQKQAKISLLRHGIRQLMVVMKRIDKNFYMTIEAVLFLLGLQGFEIVWHYTYI